MDDFDWKFYVNFYVDLKHLKNEKKALKHWNEYGKYEKRLKNKFIKNNIDCKKFIDKLVNKYKNNIKVYDASKHTDNKLLEVLFEKIYNKKINSDIILHFFKKNGIERINAINIIRNENFLITKKLRENIDNTIKYFLSNRRLQNNILFKNIITKNFNIDSDKFYFGIIVPTFNRYYITKIFIETLKHNINFDSIIFCIVDDGSDEKLLKEFDDLGFKYVVVYCNRKKNIYGSTNTLVPGSMYPLTLYIGHELIKKNCKILGVLDSDSFINENYFKICKEYTNTLDMNNVIFSAFNSGSECHKIIGDEVILNRDVLYKNMVGGISQFYSVDLYEKFKYKFTGEQSDNFWAYDYDFQISNFMINTNRKYVCLKESLVQHIGIKTTMIRCGIKHNIEDKQLVNIIYQLLKSPENSDNIDFDFDKKFINSKNIEKIFKNLLD